MTQIKTISELFGCILTMSDNDIFVYNLAKSNQETIIGKYLIENELYNHFPSNSMWYILSHENINISIHIIYDLVEIYCRYNDDIYINRFKIKDYIPFNNMVEIGYNRDTKYHVGKLLSEIITKNIWLLDINELNKKYKECIKKFGDNYEKEHSELVKYFVDYMLFEKPKDNYL